MTFPVTGFSVQQLDHMLEIYDSSFSYVADARDRVVVGMSQVSQDSASRWTRLWKYRTLGFPLSRAATVPEHSYNAAVRVTETFFPAETCGLDEADRYAMLRSVESCIWGVLMAERLMPAALASGNADLTEALTVVAFPYRSARHHAEHPDDLGYVAE